MRYLLTAMGFLLAISSGACAAPTADDDVDATDQASSVDEATALTAAMAKGLTGARLEITTTMRFKKNEAWIGTGLNAACRLRLLSSSTQVIPSVPEGDVYAVDARGIRLVRGTAGLTWTIPLANAQTQAGVSGSEADVVFECVEVGNRGAPTARFIRDLVNRSFPPTPATLIAPGID